MSHNILRLNSSHSSFCLFLLLIAANVLFTGPVAAYHPGIEEVESEIQELQVQCESLSVSDSSEMARYMVLQDSISKLQGKIIDLQQETIDSLRRQRSLEGNNRSFVNVWVFVLLFITLISVVFLIAFRNRLKSTESGGIVRLLSADIKQQHGPIKETDPTKRNVHILVIASAAMMFGSLIMYLFRVM